MNKILYFLFAAVITGMFFHLSPLTAQQKIQFRTAREAVNYYENLVGNLTRHVRSMQDENAVTSSTVQALQRKIRILEEEQKTLRQELLQLRKQISADAESRRTQFNALADQLSKQRPAERHTVPRRTPSHKHQPAPQDNEGEQEFIEHTVEQGTTLSALARAYKVSVREIEKVNKIKKGRIYAGQKLLIPATKKK